jgi:putative oxidoreductase
LQQTIPLTKLDTEKEEEMNEGKEASILYIPALRSIYDRLAPYAHTILRVTMGLFFVPHGAQKLFGLFGGRPIPDYVKAFGRMGEFWASSGWVYYIGCLEFFGGLLLALGLFTRVVAVQFVCFMAMAAFVANAPRGWFWTQGGIEAPLSWGLVCLVILIRGGGPHSLDRAIGKEF